MARDEPLRTIPAIGIAIAAADRCACLGERKRVEAGINGRVAANLHDAQISLSGRAILYEMMKVVFIFRRRQAWFVGKGRQQNGTLRIVGNDFMRIARLQGLIPLVK